MTALRKHISEQLEIIGEASLHPDWRKRPRKPRPDVVKRNRAVFTRHGMTGTPTFKTWDGMKQRCINPRCKDFPNYGGRGICICAEWRDSFETFLADMGERPDGCTIGRIDNDGDYQPSNCRWETCREQNNNRRSSRHLTLNGRTQSIAQWAREIGISDQALRYRIHAGWSPEQIVDPRLDHGLRRI